MFYSQEGAVRMMMRIEIIRKNKRKSYKKMIFIKDLVEMRILNNNSFWQISRIWS